MNLEKTKKSALILCAISGAALAVLILNLIASAVKSSGSGAFVPSFALLTNIVMTAIAAAVILNVIFLLRNIYKGESPFSDSSVNRLRVTGILLIATEPISLLLQFISNLFFPIIGADGIVAVQYTGLGGFVFVAGLAVLCVSFVFGYGAELQKQADETL